MDNVVYLEIEGVDYEPSDIFNHTVSEFKACLKFLI